MFTFDSSLSNPWNMKWSSKHWYWAHEDCFNPYKDLKFSYMVYGLVGVDNPSSMVMYMSFSRKSFINVVLTSSWCISKSYWVPKVSNTLIEFNLIMGEKGYV